jgi:hypothetical protein
LKAHTKEGCLLKDTTSSSATGHDEGLGKLLIGEDEVRIVYKSVTIYFSSIRNEHDKSARGL